MPRHAHRRSPSHAGGLAPLTLAVLLAATATAGSTGAGAAGGADLAVPAADPGVAAPYTLAATVSPAPLTAAACAADPRCVAAPVPAGGGADDEPALRAAVAAAAARSVPAVVDAAGAVLTPPVAGTVLLAAGVYTLGRPLQLPPDVDLRGSGITATTLLLSAANWRSFGYTFLVRPDGTAVPGSENTVADLTVNGNCRVGAGAPDPAVPPAAACDLGAGANYGGGLDAGDRWTVRQVRFTNLNYFKLWIAGTTGVHAVDNRFDNWGGAAASGNDNIGGGAGAESTTIEANQFDATIRGNSIDLTNASGVTIHGNTVHTTPAQAATQGVADYGSMYLEGVTAATVAGNVLVGGHLVLQSNSHYAHTGRNEHITNPRGSTITDNVIADAFGTGISVTYDDYLDTDGTPHAMAPGGSNVISGNTVLRPAYSGILVVGCLDAAKDTADSVLGNTVTDAGAGGATSLATGCGTFDTSGIGLSAGRGDAIWANTVVDDQAAPTTWYGVHLGARGGKTTPTGTVLADPTGAAAPNTATGVIGGLYRRAANAPEPVSLLGGVRAGGGVTLSWKEAYPTAANPVAGYRVYRGGRLVATLPVGSATVPGNLLSDAQAGFESGIAGWAAAPRTTLSWNQGGGVVGAGALAITATGAGQIGTYGPAVPVTAGSTVTAVASYRAVTASGAGRKVRTGVVWLDGAGAVLARVLTSNTATAASTTEPITSSYQVVVPAGAVSAQVFAVVDGCATGERYLVDRAGLVAGAITEAVTDPSAPAGASYQVVAFRAGDGELSATGTVTVP